MWPSYPKNWLTILFASLVGWFHSSLKEILDKKTLFVKILLQQSFEDNSISDDILYMIYHRHLRNKIVRIKIMVSINTRKNIGWKIHFYLQIVISCYIFSQYCVEIPLVTIIYLTAKIYVAELAISYFG